MTKIKTVCVMKVSQRQRELNHLSPQDSAEQGSGGSPESYILLIWSSRLFYSLERNPPKTLQYLPCLLKYLRDWCYAFLGLSLFLLYVIMVYAFCTMIICGMYIQYFLYFYLLHFCSSPGCYSQIELNLNPEPTCLKQMQFDPSWSHDPIRLV